MNNQDFYSTDRLIDFGMSMAVASQMARTMNQIMDETRIPVQQIKQPAPSLYYVGIDGRPVGPLNEGELSQLIAQKKVTKDTLAWMPGMAGWLPVEQVPAILKIVALMPPELPKK